ncbi:MAG: hypothetical protein OEV92_08790 [Nitrospinota bacterium]|nr:hypothetical protein [Nitrospinota bacterium]
MKLINEKDFMAEMESAKIELLDDGQPAYTGDEDVLGFDFSNLTPASDGAGLIEHMTSGSRATERAMVEALFNIVKKLGLFPVFLMAVDDEWADEEQKALLERGDLNETEVEAMEMILENDGNMKILMLEKDEMEEAVAIVTPQMTLLSNRVAAMDAQGRFLAYFSEDDEVSFNTTDPAIYQAARKLALEMRAEAPFEMIFAEDFT